MLVHRLIVFALLLIVIPSCNKKILSKDEEMLKKTAEYLWNKQSEDGGWHSENYGILKGGDALSSFILFALLNVPEEIFEVSDEKKEKAIAFIKSRINEEGALGKSDPQILEYPNYSTSYALRILYLADKEKYSAQISQMRDYLISQQFKESRGIKEDHRAYGAWGFGERLQFGMTGHTDISHTRRVLQALAETGGIADSLMVKAQRFLKVCQKDKSTVLLQPLYEPGKNSIPYDGGFYYSPLIVDANKGKTSKNDSSGIYFNSYATATSDGLLAMNALAINSTSNYSDALTWLVNHKQIEYAEGIDPNDPDEWYKVLQFYHLMVRSEVIKQTGIQSELKLPILKRLRNMQQPDGGFYNPEGGRNKEDDPLMASAMAIISMTNLL